MKSTTMIYFWLASAVVKSAVVHLRVPDGIHTDVLRRDIESSDYDVFTETKIPAGSFTPTQRDTTDLTIRAGTPFQPSSDCINCMIGCLAARGITWAWRSITTPRLKAQDDMGIWGQCGHSCTKKGLCFNHHDEKGTLITCETGQMYNYMNENGYIEA